MSAVSQRIIEELRRYAITCLYLWVCLSAILLYRAAALHVEGIDYAPWGLAALKALILGKFVVLGRAVRLGERYKHKPAIYPILHQSVVFVVMLIALSIAEEVVRGFFRGETFGTSISNVGGALEIGASTLLLWLVLLPYLGMIWLSAAVGEDKLRQILFGR